MFLRPWASLGGGSPACSRPVPWVQYCVHTPKLAGATEAAAVSQHSCCPAFSCLPILAAPKEPLVEENPAVSNKQLQKKIRLSVALDRPGPADGGGAHHGTARGKGWGPSPTQASQHLSPAEAAPRHRSSGLLLQKLPSRPQLAPHSPFSSAG